MVAFLGSPNSIALPATRKPSIGMAVNGERVPGLLGISVTRNNFLAADIFTARVALNDTGALYPASFWALQDSIELNLMISLDSGASQSVIVGPVDKVLIDQARQLMTLSGRDYTSSFIETKISEKFQNLTSSQIVQTLATRQGLQAQAQATTTPAGKYYDVDHAEVTNQISEWTLLTYLAQHEGFDIYVEGTTLFFQPPPTTSSSAPYVVTYDGSGAVPVASVSDLVMQRNLTLANDVIVKVISWNHELKAPIISSRQAQKTAQPTRPTTIPPTTYIFREPGLTQSQADAVAVARLNDLTLHERRIRMVMPGDLTLTPRSIVSLTGTETDFDQDYFVSELRIECALDRGFSMRVEAKNSSPQSVVQL
jgi:phage protein D